MQSWKRKVILVLAASASLFTLFWVTAFSAEMVAEREAGESRIAHAITTTPTSISNHATIMDVDRAIVPKGSNGRTC